MPVLREPKTVLSLSVAEKEQGTAFTQALTRETWAQIPAGNRWESLGLSLTGVKIG